jgi:uncharacterized protein YbbK (DUF523 family)
MFLHNRLANSHDFDIDGVLPLCLSVESAHVANKSRMTNFAARTLGHFANVRVAVKQLFFAAPSCGARKFARLLPQGN